MSDLNYTLLGQSLSLGGVVSRSVDLTTGEISENLPSRMDSGATPAGGQVLRGSPLSTLHNRPFIEYYEGASLIKVSKGIAGNSPIGGKKGKITGFSFASRRKLLRLVATVKIDSELPCFGTITYPSIFPSAIEWKRDLKIFTQRMVRKFPEIGIIWKQEPQDRGAPHGHFLLWGAAETDLFNFFLENWHEIAGNGDPNHRLLLLGALKDSKPCVEAVRSRRGVLRYASKYLAKAFDVSGWNNENHGRYWGVINRENIPFASKSVCDISLQKASHIMRYQRRFSKKPFNKMDKKNKKKHFNFSSLTTFGDVDQWIKNIFSEVSQDK